MNISHTSLLSRFGTSLLFILFVAGLSHTARAQCGELVVNGDFEAGNTGFTSNYTNSPGNLYPAGTYNVSNDPSASHDCFGGVDHTSGSGNSMAVNGAAVPGQIVWAQTVPVLTGTNYDFSAWVTSHCFAVSPAVLLFRVNGVQIGGNHVAPLTAFDWNNFTATWNSGVATSAIIEIVNLNTNPSGNDFGLDDISMIKIDEMPPGLTPNLGQIVWPPNHQYRVYTMDEMVPFLQDDCDPNPTLVVTSVSSSEAEDAVGSGDGSTLDDIIIAPDCRSVSVRAERQGNGDGRLYRVFITGTDNSGNSASVIFYAIVPRTPGSNPEVYDNVGYTVVGPCGTPKASASTISSSGFVLEQNYPNPFNPNTTISYSIPADGNVLLRVFDLSGSEVVTLQNGYQNVGSHRVTFNAAGLPSGIYLYRLESNGVILQRTMQLMK